MNLGDAIFLPGPIRVTGLHASVGGAAQGGQPVLDYSSTTKTVTIELDKVLHWREDGWVCADTHVHFLSPQTGLLEGAGEGVNVVNLLASQWGELMTNVGDFDGKTTFGTKESGGDGEHHLTQYVTSPA